MFGMHAGYEDRAERALRETLGDDYLRRRVSRVTYRPWVDVPNDATGTIEHQAIPRVALIIEGEAEDVRKAIVALAEELGWEEGTRDTARSPVETLASRQ